MGAAKDTYRDDLDGTQGARPARFAFNGISYRINLTQDNLSLLWQVLAPWIVAARRLGKTHGRRRAR